MSDTKTSNDERTGMRKAFEKVIEETGDREAAASDPVGNEGRQARAYAYRSIKEWAIGRRDAVSTSTPAPVDYAAIEREGKRKILEMFRQVFTPSETASERGKAFMQVVDFSNATMESINVNALAPIAEPRPAEQPTPAKSSTPHLAALHGGSWGSLLSEERYREMIAAANLDMQQLRERAERAEVDLRGALHHQDELRRFIGSEFKLPTRNLEGWKAIHEATCILRDLRKRCESLAKP